MTTPKDQWQQMQEQNLAVLKAQQDAYLAGIKAWQDQLAAATSGATTPPPTQFAPTFPQFVTPQVPTFPQFPVAIATSVPTFPTPEEISEINRAYLAKITEQQQEFMRRLSALNPSQT